jgi:hypothetical protein
MPCSGEVITLTQLPAGFANKSSNPSSSYSASQMEFVVYIFELGVTNKNSRKNAHQAAQIMGLVGTKEGERLYPNDPYMKANPNGVCTFSLGEILGVYTFKSYLGQQHAQLVSTAKNKRMKENKTAAREVWDAANEHLKMNKTASNKAFKVAHPEFLSPKQVVNEIINAALAEWVSAVPGRDKLPAVERRKMFMTENPVYKTLKKPVTEAALIDGANL